MIADLALAQADDVGEHVEVRVDRLASEAEEEGELSRGSRAGQDLEEDAQDNPCGGFVVLALAELGGGAEAHGYGSAGRPAGRALAR